jgi:outer membrane protein TolC
MLTISIVYNYIELQFLLRWKELLEAKDTNNQSIVKIRSRREKYALDTALLVLGAELEKLDTEAELTNVDILIQTHLHELKALSGMGQDMCLEIPFHEMNASVATLPCNLSLDLLARRPDLAAQKARVEAAAKLVDAAKTDFYPSVNLLGYAGLESLNWSTIFQPPSFNGSLQPAVHLPIFTAGRIRAQMMEKIAEFNQAVEGYNALILKAAKEVADELTTILRIEKEICVRAASYETTAKQEALTNRRVKHALDDQLSLLQIQNKSLDIQVILTTLQYGKQLANVLLIRSLGGGTHE